MKLQFWKKDAEKQASTPRRLTNVKSAMKNAARIFDAAKADRLSNDWSTFPITADWIIRQHQRIIVARSREQCANNDYAKKFLQMCSQNIVGPHGVKLQAGVKDRSGVLDEETNQALEHSFETWGDRDTADISGQDSWRAIQRLSIISAAKDGEFMLRIITGKKAGAYGFALQMLDVQRCPVDMDRFDLEGGNFIRAGIEYNEYSRPVAYYFTTLKDSDAWYNYQYAGNNFHRIPADEIIHGFEKDMVGQKRGLPWMATSLFRMKQMQGFEDAAIINARIGAAKMGFLQWKDGTNPEAFEDGDFAPEIDAEAGTFHELPPGMEMKEFNPTYPAGEFGSFMKHVLRSFASGVGVPYNELASDLEGVNFSSIRQGTLDSREHWKEKQQWLIESLHKPVYKAWLKQASLRNMLKTEDGLALPIEKAGRYSAVTWQARRWQWIDPRADVDGAVEAKNNFLASPGQLIREQGRDPNTVWSETARDMRAQVDAIVSQGFSKEEATQLVMLSMGRPVPPPPKPDAPPPKAING